MISVLQSFQKAGFTIHVLEIEQDIEFKRKRGQVEESVCEYVNWNSKCDCLRGSREQQWNSIQKSFEHSQSLHGPA